MIQDRKELVAVFGKDSGFAEGVDFSRKTVVAVIPRLDGPEPMFHLDGVTVEGGKLRVNCRVMPQCYFDSKHSAIGQVRAVVMNSGPLLPRWDGPQAVVIDKTTLPYELVAIPTRWAGAESADDGCPRGTFRKYSHSYDFPGRLFR